MSNKTAQRHEGDSNTPPARRRTLAQHAMNEHEMQLVGFLGKLLCLAGAAYYLPRDPRMFLALIAFATEQLPIGRALRWIALRTRPGHLPEDGGGGSTQ